MRKILLAALFIAIPFGALAQTRVVPLVTNQPVTASNPLPVTGAGIGSTTTLAPLAPAAPTATQSVIIGCQYLATVPTYSDLWQGGLRCDSDGALIAYAPDITIAGNITTQNLNPTGTATAGSAVEVTLDGRSATTIQVTGTYTGALSLQSTIDGSNWITEGGAPFNRITTAAYSATIASGLQSIWTIETAGRKKIRITALAAVTGTAVVTINVAQGGSRVDIGSSPGVTVSNTVNTLPAGQTFTNITTNTDTVINAAASTFGGISVNTAGTTSTATVYNNTTCTGSKIGTYSTTAQTSIKVDAAATVGLCVTTAGVGAADITVLWH